MFTQRHYVVIARILKTELEEAVSTGNIGAAVSVTRVAMEFAAEFSADNSSFNSQFFYDAIGMGR